MKCFHFPREKEDDDAALPFLGFLKSPESDLSASPPAPSMPGFQSSSNMVKLNCGDNRDMLMEQILHHLSPIQCSLVSRTQFLFVALIRFVPQISCNKGTVALRDIKKYQKSFELLIPSTPFISCDVDPSIRAEVWPFLLGLYENSSQEKRNSVNRHKRCIQTYMQRVFACYLKLSGHKFKMHALTWDWSRSL